MLKPLARAWHRLFLKERPSTGLSVFRVFAAFTVGAHILPTFFNPADNWFGTAFKEKNLSFFPLWFLQWVEKSPDTLVAAMMAFFALSVFFFAIGLFTQASCVAMTLGCYYFYALNSLHIGTLSFDILLVTLSLLCATPYPGDWWSVDARLFPKVREKRESRPFFIQRLLQIQIASTYFYTGLAKIANNGNWLTDNPLFYLFNGPPEGIIKEFPFRDFFAASPSVCYWMGVGIVLWELAYPALLFARRTRLFGIADGFVFHVLLVVTMHVPTIFLFLFPPQLLLFMPPRAPRRKSAP